MAVIAARNAYVVFNVYNLTGDSRNIDLPFTVDAIDTTVFGVNYKQYIDGVQDAKITVDSLWSNATATTALDASMYNTLRAGTKRWDVMPEGSASGRIVYTGNAVLTDYKIGMPVAGVVTSSISLQSSGSVTRALAA